MGRHWFESHCEFPLPRPRQVNRLLRETAKGPKRQRSLARQGMFTYQKGLFAGQRVFCIVSINFAPRAETSLFDRWWME